MQSLDEWLDYIAGQHWQSIDMGLERMRTLVARLDLQHPAPHIITVAGTNGKGSTCVACEALLRRQGRRTGVTLSPHVARFNERIRIDGAEADDALIIRAFQAVEAARRDTPLTYFEFSALAALWCFKHCEVDVAVLEIGLGGRLDAFNGVDADVAVITSIGLDHETFLGNDRNSIGSEKAGILRQGQQVALGVDMPASVYQRCDELDLDPVVVDAEFDIGAPDAAHWSVHRRAQEDSLPESMVLPYSQCAPHNLLLAYLAVNALQPLPFARIAEVAEAIHLPGRMQRVLLDGRQWLLDVAHNPAGAAFLVRQLRARQMLPAAIVCGMLQDKRHGEVFTTLRAAFDALWFCIGTAGERGMSGAELARAFAESGSETETSISVCEDWPALRTQVNSATAPGSVILAFGSFNLIEQFHLIDKSAHIESQT